MTVTASKEASAVRVSTASGTLVSVPCPTAATPEDEHRPHGQPGHAGDQAAAQARCGGKAPGQCGQLPVRLGGSRERGILRAERVQVRRAREQVSDCRAQLTARCGGRPGRPAGGRDGQRRRRGPGCQQAEGQHAAGGHEDQQADGHRARADQCRGQRRPDPADEQVLGGVHVTDQRGQQVTGPEGCQPGWGEPLQPAVDRHPDVSQHPERDVVGCQPLEIARYAAADAERADRHDGRGDRQDVRVLRGAGEQEPRCGQQRHAAAGGRRAGQDRKCQPTVQRPGQPDQPQQRPAPGCPARGLAAHGSTAVALRPGQAVRAVGISFPCSRLMIRQPPPAQPRPWLTRMTVRSARAVSMAVPISRALAGSR